MKKSVKLLNGVNWMSCFAHTLQLVIGKELHVAKTLILRVKRLIDFFMTPKQSERLEKIQKDHPSLANNEEGEEPIVCTIYILILLIYLFYTIYYTFISFLCFN